MQKVIILTYYFPPLNMTASLRALGWAKYFSEFNLYPTIICRNWEKEVNQKIKFTKEESYDIYQIKCNNSFFSSWRKSNNRIKRLMSLYSGLIFRFNNFFRRDTYPLYQFAKKIIKENKDIEYLLVIAEPFVLFKYGYHLNKKFKINWVAEYRDDWSTSEKINLNRGTKILKPLRDYSNQYRELKYLNSSAFFTSVSEYYVQKIEKLTNKKGYVIENGFFEEESPVATSQSNNFKDFTITNGGTISYGRDPTIFLNGFNELIEKYKNKLTLKCNLLGPYPYSKELIPNKEVQKLIDKYPQNYYLSERLPRKDALEILEKSHLLLIIGITIIPGVPSSKLYEYIGLRKPVIICPTDNDIIEKTLKTTGQGIPCKDKEELVDKLSLIIDDFILSGKIKLTINEDAVLTHSRRQRAGKLTALIKNI